MYAIADRSVAIANMAAMPGNGNDFRYQTKPGTAIDAAHKRIRADRFKIEKQHDRRREIERNMKRMPDDGYGRVFVAQSVTGLAGAYTG